MVIDYQQLVCNYRAKEFFFSNSFNIPLSKLNIYKKKNPKSMKSSIYSHSACRNDSTRFPFTDLEPILKTSLKAPA